ncbi:hypothetical protein [Myroides injenensis]|uniref:hypothetical protein n=2 Tax=Myroides injenensis TaxID=1183151 RepID=UPI001146175D|nr:hypothetical protein [Myroides injenensis]
MKKILTNKKSFNKKIYSLSTSLSTILLSMVLFNCSTNNKLELTPTVLKPQRVTSTDILNNNTTSKTILTDENEYLPFDILKLNSKITNNYITYNFILQGWYSSNGLNLNKIASIQINEENIVDNSLTVNCTVTIKKIPGKESNLVTGYNYTKPFTIKTDKDIKTIIIHLKEDRYGKADHKTTKVIKAYGT